MKTTATEKHVIAVSELNKIETHLIELISKSSSDILKDKFIEWQKQRNKCNDLYNEHLGEILTQTIWKQ